MEQKIIQTLVKQTQILSNRQKIDLAVVLSEKMFPAYQHFSETHHFGNSNEMLSLLEILKKNKVLTNQTFYLEKIKTFCPDTEEFASNFLATAALDFCALVYETFLHFENPNEQYLESIFYLYFNIPYLCLSETTEKPYQTSEMQTEIDFIQFCITQISAHQTIKIPEYQWIELMKNLQD